MRTSLLELLIKNENFPKRLDLDVNLKMEFCICILILRDINTKDDFLVDKFIILNQK